MTSVHADSSLSAIKPIASRTLRLCGNPVLIQLWAPVPPETGTGPWSCRVQITGIEPAVDRAVVGEDSLQALVMAMRGLRVLLRAQLPWLRWLDDEGAHLGLPLVLDDLESELAVAEALWETEKLRRQS